MLRWSALAAPLLTLLAVPAYAEAVDSPVQVAVANLREGSLVEHPRDLADATDREVFADRLLDRAPRPPDLLLVQEVLGGADLVAAGLDADPRVQATGASYAVATPTGTRRTQGRCAGPRPGRFLTVASSAVLVNKATVRVRARGELRTWGRWNPRTWGRTGRAGYGCSAHPWVLAEVDAPGQRSRRVLAVSAHVAPRGTGLQERAVRRLGAETDRLARRHGVGPSGVVALGGDLNLNRCRQPVRAPERSSCAVRAGHRALLSEGFRDAVRTLHPRGPQGVTGVGRRIDFLYVRSGVRSAWFDRCQQAWLVRQWGCGRRGTFTGRQQFERCQGRSLRHGTPGNGCTEQQYRRYYSDHPLILAGLS